MTENDRNRQQNAGTSTQENQGSNKGNQSQTTSNSGSKENNPQDGGSWNNYRTRELSDEESGEGNATPPRSE